MRNPIIVTVLSLSTLVLASACAGTSTGSGDGTTNEGVTQASGDAGVPSTEDGGAAPGRSSNDAGTAAACGGFPFSSSACGTCGSLNCCAEAAACEGNAECASLTTCTASCTDNACIASCVTAHPGGVNAYSALNKCATSSCAAECTEATTPGSRGVGDPCTADADCHGSAFCTGTSASKPGFCSTSCSTNVDCAGYPQLNNQSGFFNYCIQFQAGSDACFPGCASNADCTQYGAGLTCQRSSAGNSICYFQ